MEKAVIRLNVLIGFILCFAFVGEAKVKLPVILSDGMVIQRDDSIRIWGWADAGERVEVGFLKKTYETVADAEGNWVLILSPAKAGGPYVMTINDIELKDILIGDVWLCSGQSNMETTIQRVFERFEDEILSYENTHIRHIKLQHDYDFQGEADDIKPTAWQPVTQEYVMPMTAVPYFFARFLYERTGVPIGLVNSSVGGSPAEAWVSEAWLQDFPHYLRDMKICREEGYIEETQQLQNRRNRLYNDQLNAGDPGLAEDWKIPAYDDGDWLSVDMFSDWGSDGQRWVNGSHWFRKTVEAPAHLAGKAAVLRLGCMVDADSVFVNGVFVGNTTYQYPPRIYPIPEGLIKAGENNITIRLFSNGGAPSFVEEKPYKIVFDNEEISLLGEWKYRLGCRMLPLPGGVSFQYKATGLYNAMIAPLKNLKFKGVLWYQGESNTDRTNEYYGVMSALIDNWRKLFGETDLPFIIAQLPIFLKERDYPTESGWAQLRDVQLKLSQTIPYVGLGVNIDLGEWNDIHPLDKKDVGYRLMLQAEKLAYGNTKIIADGPVYESYQREGNKYILSFREGTNDFLPVDKVKGFALAGADGVYKWAEARIENGKVVVWSDEIAEPVQLRYAWADNPGATNLRNRAGLPASPFQIACP